jgi:hypothetical protein
VTKSVNRRDLLKGGMTAGAILAMSGRAFAQGNAANPLTASFDQTFGHAVPLPLTLPLPPPAPLFEPTYQRKLGEVARRERDRAGAKLWRTDIVAIADFGRISAWPRLHFVNMASGTVRSFLVAHGRGSDHEHDGWLKNFSNMPGSEATSRGAYLTCEWYTGKYGTSIRLEGMDGDNTHALDPAQYVGQDMVDRWGKIGRSEGCFAMAPGDFNEALWHLSGGRLLYADRIV